MIWTRSNTLALCDQRCSVCWGLGLRAGRDEETTVCKCVLRGIFRECYARFQVCAAKEKYISRVSLEANPGRQRMSNWGLKNEEFIADFCLVAKRILDEEHYQIFKYHFLLGAECRLCCHKLRIDRGTFWHCVYRIEHNLGRAYAEVEPFALWPVDEYFSSVAGRKPSEPVCPLQIAVEDELPKRKVGRPRKQVPLKTMAAGSMPA